MELVRPVAVPIILPVYLGTPTGGSVPARAIRLDVTGVPEVHSVSIFFNAQSMELLVLNSHALLRHAHCVF